MTTRATSTGHTLMFTIGVQADPGAESALKQLGDRIARTQEQASRGGRSGPSSGGGESPYDAGAKVGERNRRLQEAEDRARERSERAEIAYDERQAAREKAAAQRAAERATARQRMVEESLRKSVKPETDPDFAGFKTPDIAAAAEIETKFHESTAAKEAAIRRKAAEENKRDLDAGLRYAETVRKKSEADKVKESRAALQREAERERYAEGLSRQEEMRTAAMIRDHETAAQKQIEAQSRVSDSLQHSLQGVIKLGAGFAHLGLVGEKDMDKIVQGLMKIQGVSKVLQGSMTIASGIGGAITAAKGAGGMTGIIGRAATNPYVLGAAAVAAAGVGAYEYSNMGGQRRADIESSVSDTVVGGYAKYGYHYYNMLAGGKENRERNFENRSYGGREANTAMELANLADSNAELDRRVKAQQDARAVQARIEAKQSVRMTGTLDTNRLLYGNIGETAAVRGEFKQDRIQRGTMRGIDAQQEAAFRFGSRAALFDESTTIGERAAVSSGQAEAQRRLRNLGIDQAGQGMIGARSTNFAKFEQAQAERSRLGAVMDIDKQNAGRGKGMGTDERLQVEQRIRDLDAEMVGLAKERQGIEKTIATEKASSARAAIAGIQQEIQLRQQEGKAAADRSKSAKERFAEMDPLEQAKTLEAAKKLRSAQALAESGRGDAAEQLRKTISREDIQRAKGTGLAEFARLGTEENVRRADRSGFATLELDREEKQQVEISRQAERKLEIELKEKRDLQVNIDMDIDGQAEQIADDILEKIKVRDTALIERIKQIVDKGMSNISNSSDEQLHGQSQAMRGGR